MKQALTKIGYGPGACIIGPGICAPFDPSIHLHAGWPPLPYVSSWQVIGPVEGDRRLVIELATVDMHGGAA